MNIDWAAYKITILLYLGVLLLPVSFYFSYSSFHEIQADIRVLNSLTLSSASVLTIDDASNSLQKEEMIQKIEVAFKNLRPWMVENDSKSFYVGSEPLLQKYDSLVALWNDAKISGKKTAYVNCFQEAKELIFSLSNMLELKQNKIYNIFYVNLFVAMALLLALIFLIRAYVYKQLSKHALYDFKTRLYTKDYLLATLKEVSARTIRNKEPLSVLLLDIDTLKVHTKIVQKEKDKILEHIGISLLNSLRVSDIACRYSEHEFIIVLPNTREENVAVVINRIDKKFTDIKYTIKSIAHHENESYNDFIARFFTV